MILSCSIPFARYFAMEFSINEKLIMSLGTCLSRLALIFILRTTILSRIDVIVRFVGYNLAASQKHSSTAHEHHLRPYIIRLSEFCNTAESPLKYIRKNAQIMTRIMQAINACYKRTLILLEIKVNRDTLISHLEGSIILSAGLVHIVPGLLKKFRRLCKQP